MPKERLHLLLTDHTLEDLAPSPSSPPEDTLLRDAARLGSIVPDLLFHDVPWFRYASLSCGLHARYEGETGARRILRYLDDSPPEERTPDMQWFFIGVAGHFLADGLIHPVVRHLSNPGSWCAQRLRLSETCCHLWVESQLESYWIPRLGPKDGYRGFLAVLRRPPHWVARLVRLWRGFLLAEGWRDVPTECELLRCLAWQSRLLHWFTHPTLSRFAGRMIQVPGLRGIGVLVVPKRPILPRLLNPTISLPPGTRNPFQDDFVWRSVKRLSSRLRELSAPLP